MLTKLRQGLLGLLVIASVLAVANVARAGGGLLEPWVVVVHIVEGADSAPVDQGSFARPSTNELLLVGSDGISSAAGINEAGFAGIGAIAAGPDDEQVRLGDTAAGLLAARRACGGYPASACHIVLVNHQRPSVRDQRIAAKVTADQLTAAGYRLYSVAVGAEVKNDHLGFNWYLTGQAFQSTAADAADLIDSIAANITWTNQGEAALPQNWDNLSSIVKVWLNPYGCDLVSQWLWSSDGSCHNK